MSNLNLKTFLLALCLLFAGTAANAYKKESIDITVSGTSRNMVVFTPNTFSGKIPLMIVTHGMNQNPEYQYGADKMYELIDTAKFVVVYPRSNGNTWDIGGDGDKNFIIKVIDEMVSRYNINTNRVYWSGFSMGSMLIYHCIASMQDRIAAFAPTSGVQFSEQPWNNCKKPVNLIQCHAYGDDVFNYEQYGIHDYVQNFATKNKYTKYTKKENHRSKNGTAWFTGLRESWVTESTGNEVVLFSYNDGGHWPMAENSYEIWNFCKRFSLRAEDPVLTEAQPENNSFDLVGEAARTFSLTFDKPITPGKPTAKLVCGNRIVKLNIVETSASETLTLQVPEGTELSDGEYTLSITGIESTDGGVLSSLSLKYTIGFTEVGEDIPETGATTAQKYKGAFNKAMSVARKYYQQSESLTGYLGKKYRKELASVITLYDDFASTSPTQYQTVTDKVNTAINNLLKVFDPTTVQRDPKLDFHIYLCFGQSNMEGNATPETQDKTGISDRFKMMAAVDFSSPSRTMYQWYTATPPLCRQGTGLTPADWFGRTMVANLSDSITVGVINVAVGGAPIEDLDKDYDASDLSQKEGWYQNYLLAYDKSPYQRLVACAREAQKVGTIKGILLHQGESNNCQQDWIYKVKKIYFDLLNDLGLTAEDIPLLVGETVSQAVGGACWGHNAVIANLPSVIPNASVISSKDCPQKGDGLHFTAEGYRMIGKRYAEAMLSFMKNHTQAADTTDKVKQYIEENGSFPLEAAMFDPEIFGAGTYKYYPSRGMGIYTPGTNGVGGWEIVRNLDASKYKYLVFKFSAMPSQPVTVSIYSNSRQPGKCYTITAKQRSIQIDMDDVAAVTSISDICKVAVTSSASVYLSQVFFSDDGSTPVSIEAEEIACYEALQCPTFNLSGQAVGSDYKGIVIRSGRKYLQK